MDIRSYLDDEQRQELNLLRAKRHELEQMPKPTGDSTIVLSWIDQWTTDFTALSARAYEWIPALLEKYPHLDYFEVRRSLLKELNDDL